MKTHGRNDINMIFINIYQTCDALTCELATSFLELDEFSLRFLHPQKMLQSNFLQQPLASGIDDLKYELKKRGHWADKKVEVGSTWMCCPKNRGGCKTPPNHPLKNRVFHEINHPLWGTPIFGNTHMFHHFSLLMVSTIVLFSLHFGENELLDLEGKTSYVKLETHSAWFGVGMFLIMSNKFKISHQIAYSIIHIIS